MSVDLEDRKPTLKFNYEGFSTGEQNKVEDTTSSVKQRKLYNCIYMAKKPNKFIRLPVHLACKTCPRGQVDCYIELTTEHPKGDLQKRCATCMSAHCGFTKLDQYARAELKTWLDQEIGRRRASAKANPGLRADAIDQITEVDRAATPVLGRGKGRRRNRPDYVDSGSDGDEDEEDHRPVRNRARGNAAARSALEASGSSEAARNSEFIRQAINLVTSSQTVETQLADMQKNIDTEREARVKAEEALKTASEALKASREEFRSAQSKRVKLQQELDQIGRDTGPEREALKQAVEQALEQQTLAEDTANRIRGEREELREELQLVEESAKIAGKKMDEKMAVLRLALAQENKDLIQERSDHAKTTSDLVKWKATFAALQSL